MDVPFEIDETSGELRVSQELNFDAGTKYYSFSVEAKDNKGGKPSKEIINK